MIIISYAERIHLLNKTWWCDLETGEYKPGERDRREIANLFASEVLELFEGVRKNLQSTKIPEFTSETEELADLIVRVFDAIGGYELTKLTADIPGYGTLAEWQDSLIVNQPRNKQHDIFFLNQLCVLTGIQQDDNEKYLKSLIDLISQALIYAAAYRLPVIDAIGAKLIYNQERADHKIENRRGEHGKRF